MASGLYVRVTFNTSAIASAHVHRATLTDVTGGQGSSLTTVEVTLAGDTLILSGLS